LKTKRVAVLVAVAAACLGMYATAWAHMDHPVPTFAPQGELSTAVNAGGEDAEWELVSTIPTGNPHTDLDFFRSGGEIYASVGTLANGPNAGGQTFVKLTDGGEVKPSYVTGHPSASCLAATSSATGLQHDAEATPKGGQILNAPNPVADQRDAQLIVDATDATGRCHDQGVLGAANAQQGGLELIDVTDPAKPKEIGLTTHVGQAHTVNIDPKRPHIAIVSSSDSVTVNSEGKRSNEVQATPPNAQSNALDGIELVDMSSCMNFPAGTTLEQKRDACRPQVFRYRWPDPNIANSHRYKQVVGACHETEIYPDDKLACASLMSTVLFDIRGAFDDNGTPADFTDDKLRGNPLPCRVRDSSTTSPIPGLKTGAKVTDCVNGEVNGAAQPLNVFDWQKIGSPSLEGVQRIGTAHHMGFENQQQQALNAPYNSKQDIFVSHEAELTGSGKFVLVTDERGGGVLPVGASCSPGPDVEAGNGGVHAFPVSRLRQEPAPTAEEGQEAQYAKSSSGQRAIYRTPIRTQPQASVCTSHVMQQMPGQNRIFMAWYSQGTQVVDFVENADGTIDFKQAGWFTPEGSNQWVSAIFKAQENPDGTFTYWGATGDFALSGVGRNAIDIYKVTLPPAPEVNGGPQFERSPVRGAQPGAACASAAGFENATATRKRAGIRFEFTARGGKRTRVKLFRSSSGRNVRGKAKLVKDFGRRARSFQWRGNRKLPEGYYFAKFATKAPNGQTDTRRVGLRRTANRFFRLRAFDRREACSLVREMRLKSPVFGGTANRRMKLAFRLEESSRARIVVRRKGKVVKRFKAKNYRGGRTHRKGIKLPPGAKGGEYQVVLKATHPGRAVNVVITGRKV
jgi:hypothetical protein